MFDILHSLFKRPFTLSREDGDKGILMDLSVFATFCDVLLYLLIYKC